MRRAVVRGCPFGAKSGNRKRPRCWDWKQRYGLGADPGKRSVRANKDSRPLFFPPASRSDKELLSNGAFDFTYDAEGNETSKTTIATGDKWVYAYNNANELVSAVESTSDGTVEKQVAYKYDAFGNLIEEDVTVPNQPTSITQFRIAWTGTGGPSPGTSTADVNWHVWGNLDGNGSLTTRFLNGPAAN